MGLTISDDFIDDEVISNESRVISPVSTPVSMPSLKSIGPPKILKYHPESKKKELIAPLPESRIEAEAPEDILQFFKVCVYFLSLRFFCCLFVFFLSDCP